MQKYVIAEQNISKFVLWDTCAVRLQRCKIKGKLLFDL